MRACAESLIEALGELGPIFMYSNYERTTINGFIAHYPDLAIILGKIIDRLYDLYPLTKKHFYHPDMHGSHRLPRRRFSTSPKSGRRNHLGIG